MLGPQMIVEAEGQRGVTCPDFMNCCTPDETPVVWEGKPTFEGVPTASLRVVGPESAKPEIEGCGVGRGAECCIFLTAGPDGFCCERFGPLRFTLIFRKSGMAAQREPVAPYPGCFLKAN